MLTGKQLTRLLAGGFAAGASILILLASVPGWGVPAVDWFFLLNGGLLLSSGAYVFYGRVPPRSKRDDAVFFFCGFLPAFMLLGRGVGRISPDDWRAGMILVIGLCLALMPVVLHLNWMVSPEEKAESPKTEELAEST